MDIKFADYEFRIFNRWGQLVFETRDLWPEGAIELGVIKNSFIKKLAYWFEKRCYNASSLLVTLSPGMKTYIEDKHHHPNVISVTNAANITLFATPQSFPENITFVYPLKYAIYTGNIGEVNNSWWLLNTAIELTKRGREDIVIFMIGEGKQREELEQKAKELELKNFIRLGLMPKEKLVPLIQHALVSLVPLKGTPLLDTSSPNKFFESMAAGVPVIQNTNGWMKEFLDINKVGFTIDPNSAEKLADCLVLMEENPSIREKMKPLAVEIAKNEFDKNMLAKKMLNAIEKIVG
jgi:glycosyltransferase involved in cell wall biosynthesis